ncbi:MAG: hypothetical protein DMF78_19045 [Acidobacteria bacterium]|nr:MAG: hypothetical protein DMF78_19045 [Acidobacteriota bacterium]
MSGASAARAPRVCHAIAPSTTAAPSAAGGAGRSPRTRKTQMGFAIGSTIPTSDAWTAVTVFNPRRKSAYAPAIWKMPRKRSTATDRHAGSGDCATTGRSARAARTLPQIVAASAGAPR